MKNLLNYILEAQSNSNFELSFVPSSKYGDSSIKLRRSTLADWAKITESRFNKIKTSIQDGSCGYEVLDKLNHDDFIIAGKGDKDNIDDVIIWLGKEFDIKCPAVHKSEKIGHITIEYSGEPWIKCIPMDENYGDFVDLYNKQRLKEFPYIYKVPKDKGKQILKNLNLI